MEYFGRIWDKVRCFGNTMGEHKGNMGNITGNPLKTWGTSLGTNGNRMKT